MRHGITAYVLRGTLLYVLVAAAAFGSAGVRDFSKVDCSRINAELGRGVTLLDSDDVAAAATVFLRAFESEQRRTPGDANALACAMTLLGTTEFRQGSSEAAVEWHRRALALPGTSAKLAAIVAGNLASALVTAGRLSEALEWAQSAVRQCEAAFGPETPEVLQGLGLVALIHLQRGDPDRAEPLFRRVLSQFERLDGRDAREAGVSALMLGEVYLATDRVAQARHLFQRALDVFLALRERGMPHDIPVARANLGVALALQHRYREAHELLRELATEAERRVGATDLISQALMTRIGQLEILLGQADAGKQRIERVIASLEATYGPQSERVTRALAVYRSTLVRIKDKQALKDLDKRLKARKVAWEV